MPLSRAHPRTVILPLPSPEKEMMGYVGNFSASLLFLFVFSAFLAKGNVEVTGVSGTPAAIKWRTMCVRLRLASRVHFR